MLNQNCRTIKNKLFFTVILFVFSQNLYAQLSKTTGFYPLIGRFAISAEGGGALGFTDYSSSNIDLIWRGSAEYFFNTNSRNLFGLSLFGGTGNINGNDPGKQIQDFKTSLAFYGGGLTYGYLVGDALFPTLFAGVSNLNFDPKDVNENPLPNNQSGAYSKNAFNLNLELGLRFLATEDLGIKLAFGTAYNFNDNLDDIEPGKQKDIFYVGYIGLTYIINARKDSDKDGIEDSRDLCPDTPIGIDVDENGCPFDEDRDGVADYLDQCPKTPARVTVDKNGCPVDSDNDGIADYIDRCPDTPAGAKVNANGCPDDSDFDGVPDYADKCPETPGGVVVDSTGCPIDTDKDGVPDFQDRCPNTPEGALVDKTGCPLDTDGDGVPDYQDKCPDTPYGARIYPDGCSENFREYDFNSASLFNNNESVIRSDAFVELNKVTARLKLHPQVKWRIEGHTDDTGDPEQTKVLSLQRANAVYEYFISHGLSKEMFEVVGLGADFPVADNSTPQGRKMNNRIVLMRTN